MPYYVYILECADNTFYCGYTTNLEKRIITHNTSKTGAKYTKSRRPVKLVYYEEFFSLGEALKREYAVKQLKKAEKATLIKNFNSSKVNC